MNTQQKVISSPLHDVLVRKLHPDEFPRLSGVMAAVVVFVLDTTFIEPPIVEIKVERGVLFYGLGTNSRLNVSFAICRIVTQLAESDRRGRVGFLTAEITT